MNMNEKCQMLPIIHTQTAVYHSAKSENGVFHLGYYKYGKDVQKWIKLLYELDLVDYHYMQNMKLLQDKEIAEYTRDEVLTHMTFIIRAERFCDGTIAVSLENGEIEALCTRLHEITK